VSYPNREEAAQMTQDILIDVRDVGRRWAGVNTEIPAEIAIAEVCDAIDALTEDLVYG
jgi:hypothetical protein